jgi:hypothetical protein
VTGDYLVRLLAFAKHAIPFEGAAFIPVATKAISKPVDHVGWVVWNAVTHLLLLRRMVDFGEPHTLNVKKARHLGGPSLLNGI